MKFWEKATSTRFVEGCNFEEFSAYLAKLGLYTAKGEMEKLKLGVGFEPTCLGI